MNERAPAFDIVDTALRLTAIALLLRPMGPWFIKPVILGLGVLVLISPRAMRSSTVWLVMAIAIGLRIADDWPLSDNHIYLIGYWALAIGLALWHEPSASDAAQALARTSRWLLGLAFLFAVLWKAVLSPDFVDGRFFRVTLLTDPRFGEPAMLIGGLSAEQLAADRHALEPAPHGAELLDPPAIVEPARLRWFATASTWSVLVLETAIALLMLLPSRPTIALLGHLALLTFCGVTYAFAPVAGFGWVLLVMGLVLVEPGRVWLARTYVAGFLVVLFYSELPWAGLLLDVLR